MADFSIGDISKRLGDIQRTYTWKLHIHPPKSVMEVMDFKDDFFMDDLAIRCRSVSIPGRSNDVITTNYAGREQFFPSRTKFTNPLTIVYEEFADRKITRFLYAWQQLVTNAVESGNNKRSYAVDCFLSLYDYDFDPATSAKKLQYFKIINAWPESVAEVALSYADNNSVQYSLSLRYDTWEYKNG